MLETMRRRSAGVVLWIIFGILIAVFVFSSPLTAGDGCFSGPPTFSPMTIDGSELGKNDWFFSFNSRSGGTKRQRIESALEDLIRRELLASEAERRGLAVSDDV